ncbi:hypothetical protein HYPDE_23243 [Hyphomicrobium denitrificans 1NES1]|uniref:Uncharacterized protein n=1 Tax=Hyphomicrobium denitrificans 1NES1 TaxID=670307 RepID=N0B8E5_9HYPH|nr:hypothetical protein HYPDE_23243 [Hyphomicrobium denitrificans 1NES1]
MWTTPLLQEESGVRLAVRCKSCVRPVGAARMTAGPDGIRRPGPNQIDGLDARVRYRVLPTYSSTASHHAIITLAICCFDSTILMRPFPNPSGGR